MRAHARTRENPANPPFAAPTLGGAAVPNRQNRPKWAEIRRSPQRETWFLAGARSFANPGRRVRRGEDRRGHRRDQHVLDAARTRLDARPAVLCRRGRQRGPGEYFRPARPDRDRPARHRNRAVTGERPRCASWRSSTLNCPGLRATQWSRPRRSTCWCRAPLQYRARHRAPRRSDRPRAAFCRRGRQRGPGEYFRPARPDRDRPARHRNRAVTVSGPDAARRYNTGLGIEHLDGAIARARLVVAQLNPELPWSEGDTMVEAEAVDLLVPAAEPPLERPAMSAPRRPRASGSPKSNGRSTRLAARTPPHQTRRSVTPASLDQRTLPRQDRVPCASAKGGSAAGGKWPPPRRGSGARGRPSVATLRDLARTLARVSNREQLAKIEVSGRAGQFSVGSAAGASARRLMSSPIVRYWSASRHWRSLRPRADQERRAWHANGGRSVFGWDRCSNAVARVDRY